MAWPGDWKELGIAPTDDLLAIRRAYASRLRTTRPDDDAAAYQRLREAYDRALARAEVSRRPQRVPRPPPTSDATEATAPPVFVEERPDAPPSEAPAAPIAFVTTSLDSAPLTAPLPSIVFAPVASPAPQAPGIAPPSIVFAADLVPPLSGQAPAPPPIVFAPLDVDLDIVAAPISSIAPPAAPADSLQRVLDDFGTALRDGQALQSWPALQRRLDQLPLASRGRASVTFADLVLDQRTLPAPLLLAMREHFAWTRDYRLARQLGAERSHRLRERLDELAPEPITDPELLHSHRHLIWFSELTAWHADLAAGLLTVLVGRSMQRALVGTDTTTLRRLGVGPPPVLQSRLQGAMWLRIFALLFVLGGIGAWLGARESGATPASISAIAAWWFVSFALIPGLVLRAHAFYAFVVPATWRSRLDVWRESTLLPLAAAMLLGAAAALFVVAARASWSPWAGVLIVLSMLVWTALAWPHELSHAAMCIAMTILAGVYVRSRLDDVDFFAFGVGVVAWSFACAWMFERGRHRPGQRWMRAWREAGRHEQDTVRALLFLPALPYFLLLGARRFGRDLVIAALAAGIGFSVMPVAPPVVQRWSPLMVPITFFILLGLQRVATHLTDRVLARSRARVAG